MPYAKLLPAGAVVVLACFALVALLKSRRSAGPMLMRGRGLPPLKGSLDANAHGRGVSVALGHEILEMLETGRRAEASRSCETERAGARRRPRPRSSSWII
jgi:hypothetical protein